MIFPTSTTIAGETPFSLIYENLQSKKIDVDTQNSYSM